MIESLGQEDKSKREKETKTWLEKRDLPESIYDRLSNNLKDLLQNSVCIPTKTISSQQRRELYNGICSLLEFRSCDYKSGESVTDDYLRDFFSPLSEKERKPMDEWGGE
jgi:hypothetical protein